MNTRSSLTVVYVTNGTNRNGELVSLYRRHWGQPRRPTRLRHARRTHRPHAPTTEPADDQCR